ncbi:MAG: DUF1501 domain-containing protein [Planctomycetes bacterium]|nr:DUF1501 domain-containing protein [Planctomycetota bacterium]
MLDLNVGGVSSNCNGHSRRDFLRVGGLSALGLTLANFFRAQAVASENAPAAPQRRNVNCILMWMQGGPSHIDTLDPKPDAPAEIRGEFSTIQTRQPGVRVVEHFPMLAQQFDKLSLIRGHDPQNGSHGVADHIMMTGHRFNPALPFPCFGSVVAKERGYRNNMFPFVQLGRNIDRRFNGGIGGFLGDQYNPFEVHDDPSSPAFRVRDLSIASDAERRRLQRRYSMLQEMDRYQREMESNQSVQARDVFYQRAHSLITSPAAKDAFDLSRETDRVRDQYGRNSLGQSCLLARRLIESGVHFVTVTDGGWDTHVNNFRSLKDRLLPRLDRAYASLLADLHTRGLLDNTLVVWFGDFGRTPIVNPSAGRDHWSTAGVATMGGGGIRLGQTIGATNARAEVVVDTPVRPQDLAATIYHALGIPLNTWYRAQDGRPIELVPTGRPVRQLI